MEGVRVLEVAQFTFVSAAGAVLEELVCTSDVFLTNFHGSAITAFRRNAQVKEQSKGYSIAGAAGRKHSSMRIPSASSLPNEGCRYG